jgi:16S rRNA (guanine527-N7)-methyltransferase
MTPEKILTRQRLRRLSETYSVTLSPLQERQLEIFLGLLLKWRSQINLMSEPNIDRLLDLHVFESLWLAHTMLPSRGRMADIGSGAGFPSIPAKIYTGRLSLVCIERQHKKTTFLGEAVRQAKLEDVALFSGRWQDFTSWETVDFVTLRALHPPAELLQRLARQGLALFHLHSAEQPLAGSTYQCVRQVQVPASRQRIASFLRPT